MPSTGCWQAQTYWKIYNYYEAQARANGQVLLRVNMDETSVGLVQKPLKGVVMRIGRRVRRNVPARMRVSRGLQRTNLTYVAFDSDDADFTKQLPQFIIGDRRSFQMRNYQTLFDASPQNIVLARGPSGWCTHKILKHILRVLGEVCRAARPGHQVVLCLDTASSHLHAEVLRTFHEENILPLLVPAKTTSLLQPLDVFVFRSFRASTA